jgi:hypothetical protein
LSVNLVNLLSVRVENIPALALDRLIGLPYIFDLILLHAPASTQGLTESLSNMMYRPENIRTFLANEGTQFLLDLLLQMGQSEAHKLHSFNFLSLFEHCIPHFTTE